jgi:hypothetical protein
MHVNMHRGLELGKGIIKTIAISRPNILGTCMSKNTRLCFNSITISHPQILVEDSMTVALMAEIMKDDDTDMETDVTDPITERKLLGPEAEEVGQGGHVTRSHFILVFNRCSFVI